MTLYTFTHLGKVTKAVRPILLPGKVLSQSEADCTSPEVKLYFSQIVYPQLLTIETVAMDGIVIGHIGLLQNSVAVLLSLTTIQSLLHIPDMEDQRKVVVQGQPDLGTKGKPLQLLVSKTPTN